MKTILFVLVSVPLLLGNAFAGKLLDEVTHNDDSMARQDYKTSAPTSQHSNSATQKGVKGSGSAMNPNGNSTFTKQPDHRSSTQGSYGEGSRMY